MSTRSPTSAESTTRILGIDPGLNITGYGVVDIRDHRLELVEAGVVRSNRRHDLGQRLQSIHEGITDVIGTLHPQVVAIEELYSHYERPTTAILMGHARGAICLAVAMCGLQLTPYAATQIKKVLTGNGRAPKGQVQLAVARQLGLTEALDPPDVADALAIAACHYYLTMKPASLM